MPARPVISNYGTPTEKVSEFLYNQLKPVMREGMSYIKDSNNFFHKTRDLKDIPNGGLLVTADAIGLHPSIPHGAGLQGPKEVLECKKDKKISTNDLVKVAAFVLKTTTLNLVEKLNTRHQGLPLVQDLSLYMLLFLWTK